MTSVASLQVITTALHKCSLPMKTQNIVMYLLRETLLSLNALIYKSVYIIYSLLFMFETNN